jgi:hypothetical protein
MTDVQAHGAVGDGRTDNTRAIQALIDAASPGTEVQIPPGTHLVGPLLIRADGVRLRGAGADSVLRFAGGGDVLLQSEANGISVEDLRLEDGGQPAILMGQNVRSGAGDGDSVVAPTAIFDGFTARGLELTCTNGASRGIVVSDTHRALVEDCHIAQSGTASEREEGGICIQSVRDTAVEGCTIRGNTVTGGFFRGIQSRGRGVRRDLRIEGNQVSGSVRCGIWAYRAEGLTITGNRVDDSGGDGIFFDPTTSRQGTGLCASNRVERCARYGIVTEEAKNGSAIRDNAISACGTGILVGGGCRGLAVSGNTIADSREYGIALDRHAGTANKLPIEDISLVGNVIQRSGITGIMAKRVRGSLSVDQNTIDESGRLGAAGGVAREDAPDRGVAGRGSPSRGLGRWLRRAFGRGRRRSSRGS